MLRNQNSVSFSINFIWQTYTRKLIRLLFLKANLSSKKGASLVLIKSLFRAKRASPDKVFSHGTPQPRFQSWLPWKLAYKPLFWGGDEFRVEVGTVPRWHSGRVAGSQAKHPGFNPCVRKVCFSPPSSLGQASTEHSLGSRYKGYNPDITSCMSWKGKGR